MTVCVPSKELSVMGDCHTAIVTLPPRLGPAVGTAVGAVVGGLVAAGADELATDEADELEAAGGGGALVGSGVGAAQALMATMRKIDSANQTINFRACIFFSSFNCCTTSNLTRLMYEIPRLPHLLRKIKR